MLHSQRSHVEWDDGLPRAAGNVWFLVPYVILGVIATAETG